MRLDNTDNAWLTYSKNDRKELDELCGSYIEFLSKCKTERECASEIVSMARKAGYKDLDEIVAKGKHLKHGDKVYAVGMGKTVALFNLGNEPFENGMNILGAHIDSPRLDLKQNPLYEDGGMAYFNTHYYGGIKKYQYVTIPLALHGIVAKTDGTLVEVSIGEEDDEPVFTITDILIHLAGEQMEKKASKAVEGENLDVLIGSIPIKSKEKDPVKNNILKILKDKYSIEESDFMSAEIEVVPAGKARTLGLDESMILSYGLSTPDVERTGVCLLVDKEEIGSVGATGMRSRFFENALAEVMNAAGVYSDLAMRRTLQNSKMLSSDVSASYDPLYGSVFDKQNSAYFGHGVVFNKYTGSRGKSGSNDANAEYMAKLRAILSDAGVAYHTAELGKVDQGGGGTIAYILAEYGMNVIDSGVAVLNMHAPWEIISKADLYEAEKGYEVFLKEAGRRN